jgi:hypothetical protein
MKFVWKDKVCNKPTGQWYYVSTIQGGDVSGLPPSPNLYQTVVMEARGLRQFFWPKILCQVHSWGLEDAGRSHHTALAIVIEHEPSVWTDQNTFLRMGKEMKDRRAKQQAQIYREIREEPSR